jgi:hypothetical protein
MSSGTAGLYYCFLAREDNSLDGVGFQCKTLFITKSKIKNKYRPAWVFVCQPIEIKNTKWQAKSIIVIKAQVFWHIAVSNSNKTSLLCL